MLKGWKPGMQRMFSMDQTYTLLVMDGSHYNIVYYIVHSIDRGSGIDDQS
jgi:hypothetical protein